MHNFFKNRELASFALVEDIDIQPEEFVRTSGITKEEGKDWSYTKSGHLPNGTSHGTYSKEGKKNGWEKEKRLNYKMGKLHGSFYGSFRNAFFFECSGNFEEGVPVGKFRFCGEFMRIKKEESFLSFENGMPTFFEGVRNFPIIWEGKTLSLDGKVYKNISFSEQKFLFFESETPLSVGFWKCPSHILEKYSTKVYGTNEQGKMKRIHIPVFPQ
ncbi:hypothetical protein A9K97_gp257 [Tokyovirus A1]|uniref:hypothetical protein n=1 Tax=Tokyovirus A1 TaxID=1826170 RepID=UPI0007A98480|nr:hypothetical protein A9K97_gp257 [Tokyovirus A1]BAU80094.1 hypothetical protein [Tokyovirus A1]